jgi:hypothetical protein
VLTVGTAPSYATGTVELPVSLDPRGIGIGALNYTVIAPAPPLAYESCDEGPIPLAVDAEQTCRADGPGAATIAIVNRPTIPVPPLGAGVITTLTLRVTAGAEGSHAVCIVPESVRLGSVDGPDVCTAPPVCGAVEVDGTCAMQGDCNCDGRVNSGDRICLIAKFFDLVPEGTCPCEDCNLSGELNAADAPCITLCAFNRCPATGTDS